MNAKILKVAITGSLASGKSSLLEAFRKMGAYTVSADQIGHRLLDQPFIKQSITQKFGPSVLTHRDQLASRVFNDPVALKELESILHPAIRQELHREYALAQSQHAPLFVAEVPLLFEAGWESDFDRTISVCAPLETRQTRSSLTPEMFRLRESRQFLEKDKTERADFCLVNQGSKEELARQGQALFNKLLSLKGPSHHAAG